LSNSRKPVKQSVYTTRGYTIDDECARSTYSLRPTRDPSKAVSNPQLFKVRPLSLAGQTYIAKPNNTGMPDTKFIVVKVAAHCVTSLVAHLAISCKLKSCPTFSKRPKLRTNTCRYPSVARVYSSRLISTVSTTLLVFSPPLSGFCNSAFSSFSGAMLATMRAVGRCQWGQWKIDGPVEQRGSLSIITHLESTRMIRIYGWVRTSPIAER
jgi:hypothetical protein